MGTGEVVQLVTSAVVLPLLGWVVARINAIARESRDLWTWHKPDDKGRQEWKNPELKRALAEVVDEIRGLREDLRSRS